MGFSQDTALNKTTEEWINQLTSDRVRHRDEAEDYLRKTPGVYDQLVTFSQSTSNAEAQIRANNILRHLKGFRWELIGIRKGHSTVTKGDIMLRGLVKAPNGKTLFTRAQDFIREWHPGAIEPHRTIIQSGWGIKDDALVDGFARGIAVSPNGKVMVTCSEQGEVLVYDTKTLAVTHRLAPDDAKPYIKSGKPYPDGLMFSAMFMPDNNRIVTGHRRIVYMWDIRKENKLLWKSILPGPARSIVLTKRRDRILVSVDSENDNNTATLFSLSVGNGKPASQFEFSTRLVGLSFDQAGNRLLGTGDKGSAWVYSYDQQSRTFANNPKQYGPIGKTCQGAIWGVDDQTILTTSRNPKNAMVEWNLESGDMIWKSPPLDFGLGGLTWIAHDRIAVLGEKGMMSFWRFKGDQ